MKIQKQIPNWENCNFSNNNSLEDFASFQIFPEGRKKSVDFKDWADYIMKGTHLPK